MAWPASAPANPENITPFTLSSQGTLTTEGAFITTITFSLTSAT